MAAEPDGGLRDLDRHLARLAGSAAWFGFPFDEDGTRRRLAGAVSAGTAARVRLLLHRDWRVDVERHPLPPPGRGPVRLAVDAEPVDAGSVWLRHETTRPAACTERTARHPDADDVVLTSAAGQVTETTIANLAVRLDGRWWTPPLPAACLPGVARPAGRGGPAARARPDTRGPAPRRGPRRRRLAARLATRRPHALRVACRGRAPLRARSESSSRTAGRDRGPAAARRGQEVTQTCPRSRRCGPCPPGRMSSSKISVGRNTEQQALGMSTTPPMRPSMGEVPRMR